MTNTYKSVTKMMDLINAECKHKDVRVVHADETPGKVLRITANLIRKMISTEAYGHDKETNTAVAAYLQHSDETTLPPGITWWTPPTRPYARTRFSGRWRTVRV